MDRNSFIARDENLETDYYLLIQKRIDKLLMFFHFEHQFLENLYRCRDSRNIQEFYTYLDDDHLSILGW